jgi:hypothetical protein
MLIESTNRGAIYINPKQVIMVSITSEQFDSAELNVWFHDDDEPITFENSHDIITKYAQKLDRYFNEGH